MIDRYACSIILELERRKTARFGDLLGTVRNPRTLSRKLKGLASIGLVESDGGVYSLSPRGRRAAELAEGWFELLDGARIEVRNLDRIPHRAFAEVLGSYCRILASRYRGRLLGVLVFGSVARGDWTEDSDIDLLVVVEGWNKPTWERSRELAKAVEELRRMPEYRDAVERGFIPIIQHYPIDAEEARRTHRIYIDACMDGIVLYERDRFLTGLLSAFRQRMVDMKARRVCLPKGYYWVLWSGRAGEVFEL